MEYHSNNPAYTQKRLSGLARMKGKTYEEVFGPEKAKAMKEKMRQAKLGKKMPWNKGFKGAKHPNWKGGITPIKKRLRSSKKWKEWRESIFKRDNYTCQECHIKGGSLEPHHIIPLAETLSRVFDVSNGITLCRTCHLKTIRKEKLFVDKYLQIVNES